MKIWKKSKKKKTKQSSRERKLKQSANLVTIIIFMRKAAHFLQNLQFWGLCAFILTKISIKLKICQLFHLQPLEFTNGKKAKLLFCTSTSACMWVKNLHVLFLCFLQLIKRL